MPAVAIWTVILVVVAASMGLAALVAISFGRASSRADEQSDRLIAERRLAEREFASARTRVDAGQDDVPADGDVAEVGP